MTKRTRIADRKAGAELTPQPAGFAIRKLPSGVRGLDEILGGGIPEFSLNLISGSPGSGKTTLAHQIVFANATEKNPALYFTVLGEPALKMLRYQQQFSFFEPSKVGQVVRFVSLADILVEQGLKGVMETIATRVSETHPSMVVVDSFRSAVCRATSSEGQAEMQNFIIQLAQFLTSWQATTILVGEYEKDEMRDNPLFTIVDGILWLSQEAERNSVVRKLQILKLRGQYSVPGLHTIRIDHSGLQTFSRTLGLSKKKQSETRGKNRLSTGVPGLDRMLGGGVLEGDSLLVTGPTGTGKSALATQFIAEGLKAGEPGIIVIFEERPAAYIRRAKALGLDFEKPQRAGQLEILYLRPLDLSVDETMQEILDAIARVGAKRLVIDSLVGFEMALAPGFRTDYRESLYRMICALTGAGVTIFSTVEVEDSFTGMSFSHYTISFLTDDIIRLRYVEIDGQLRKVLVVVKMRGGNHSKDIREYVITDKGMQILDPRKTDYLRLSTGLPERYGQVPEAAPEPREAR